MNSLLKTFQLFVVCIVLATSVSAQKVIKRIVENGELRVGMTGNQPPFAMKSKDGRTIGYEVDMAQLLAQSMNVELKIVILPFDQLIPALKDGKIDAIMSGMTITPDRNMEVSFAGPYMVSGRSILTKSNVLARTMDTQELNEYPSMKIAALAGSTSEYFATSYLDNVEVVTVGNYDQALAKLRNDEVKAVVADYTYCIVTAVKNQYDGFLALDQPLTIEPIGVALPQGDAAFVNLIDNYLKALELAGIFEQLQYQWLENPTWIMQVE